MDLIHSDVIGPLKVKGYDGSRYIATFQCDRTKAAAVYLMKTKGDLTDCFKHFKNHYERTGVKIYRLRDDNGGEYISGKLQDFLKQEGIVWEPTVAGNPQMNGAAERLGRTLWTKAVVMLRYTGIPLKYWPEAVQCAAYLYMRSPHSAIGKTPFEALHQAKPDLRHIRTFGSIVFNANTKDVPKLGEKAKEGVLVGFEGDHIVRILTPEGKIIRGTNVHIVEKLMFRNLPEETDEELWDDVLEAVRIKPTPQTNPISTMLPNQLVGPKRRRDEIDELIEDYSGSRQLRTPALPIPSASTVRSASPPAAPSASIPPATPTNPRPFRPPDVPQRFADRMTIPPTIASSTPVSLVHRYAGRGNSNQSILQTAASFRPRRATTRPRSPVPAPRVASLERSVPSPPE